MNARRPIRATVLAFAICALVVPDALASHLKPNVSPSDAGYSVTAMPYLAPDIETRSVAVVEVSSSCADRQKGWSIVAVKVASRERRVTAVELTAYASEIDQLGTPLRSWTSAPIDLAQPIASGAVAALDVELLTQADLKTILTAKHRDFRVDVAVTKAVFDDGTEWIAPSSVRLRYQEGIAEAANGFAIVRAAYVSPAQIFCHVTCTYHQTTGKYTCETANPSNTKCVISGGGAACTVSFPCS